MGKGGGGTDLHSRQLPEGNHPQPRGILSHTCGSKKYLQIFLNFFDDSVCFDKRNNHRQPNGIFPHTCGSENVNISIWTFLEYFEWRKKTALCCPQTRGTLRKQYCIVLHIVKQGVPSCLHSCDNVATRCVSESLSSVSIFRTNLTWKSCAVIIWLALTAPCRANKSYNKQSLEKTQLEGVENYLDKFIPFYWHCDPSYKE